MNRCDRCRYWGLRLDGGYDDGDYNRCERLQLDPDYQVHRSDHDAVVVAAENEEPVSPLRVELALLGNDYNTLYTRAAFGCVLFEEKS